MQVSYCIRNRKIPARPVVRRGADERVGTLGDLGRSDSRSSRFYPLQLDFTGGQCRGNLKAYEAGTNNQRVFPEEILFNTAALSSYFCC